MASAPIAPKGEKKNTKFVTKGATPKSRNAVADLFAGIEKLDPDGGSVYALKSDVLKLTLNVSLKDIRDAVKKGSGPKKGSDSRKKTNEPPKKHAWKREWEADNAFITWRAYQDELKKIKSDEQTQEEKDKLKRLFDAAFRVKNEILARYDLPPREPKNKT